MSNSFVQKLEETIESNLQNEQFGVEELAAEIGISRSQVHRKLKAINGQSISQFIREYRLKRSMDYLQNEELTAAEVAYKVGFGSPSYFNKCFHEFYGFPPGEARKQELQKETVQETKKEETEKRFSWLKPTVIVVLIVSTLIIVYNRVKKDDSLTLEKKEYSIAVLPFKNLSSDLGTNYFADGVMDAILGDLSRINDFRVISRTSVEKYRTSQVSVQEIGADLDVDMVLEGSVQKSQNTVRIIVQLILIENDAHIWSKTYDRELDDIFNTQSEIAREVALEIKRELTDEEIEVINETSTRDLLAFELLQKGFQKHAEFFYEMNPEDLDSATLYYRQAITKDPAFYRAKVGLCWSWLDRVRWLGEDEMLLDSALNVANQLNWEYPNRSNILTLLGSLYRFKGPVSAQALEFLTKAVALNPNDVRSLEVLGYYYRAEEHRYDLSLKLYERAAAVEPFAAVHYAGLGFCWLELNEYGEAEKWFNKALEIQPDFAGAIIGQGLIKIYESNDLEEAIELFKVGYEKNPENLYLLHQIAQIYSWAGDFENSLIYFEQLKGKVESEDYNITKSTPWYPHRYAYTLWNLDRKSEADRYFEQEIEIDMRSLSNPSESVMSDVYYDLAAVYSFWGSEDESVNWLNKIPENNGWGNPAYLRIDPLFSNLKEDSRLDKYYSEYENNIQQQKKNYLEMSDISFREFTAMINEN